MPDLLLFLFTACTLTATGRQVSLWLRMPPDTIPLERNLIGFALGLGLLSYSMLALGLFGWLTLKGVLILSVVLFAPGFRQWKIMRADLIDTVRQGLRPTWQGWGTAVLFAFFGIVALFGVYSPPTLLEWDSLAYHLADPKLYIQAHRIYYLPWESHSNFAFTAEMWYTFGLLVRGVPLAKFFHFACGTATCLALYAFGRRHLQASVGLWAAVLFAATPLVFWEMGTAYADLATTFFATLTLYAVANALADKLSTPWLIISAVLMGLTLSTKATSLTTLSLFALGIFAGSVWHCRQGWGAALKTVALWGTIAVAVGLPWYLKSAIYTGNPVYPFYFHLFGGKYWNAANAAAYDASNAAFGMGRSPDKLLLLPWNLTMALLPGHFPQVLLPFNNYAKEVMTISPVLLAALFFPAFGRGAGIVVKALGAYAVCGTLLWFATAQHVRYLLPLLPVLCLLASRVLVHSLRARWISGYSLAALQLVSLCFSAWIGTQLIAAQAPVVFGRQTMGDYLSRADYHFPAYQFINSNLPTHAKLVSYGSPLAFYCDRPLLWGEAKHSAYIPYETFHTSNDLLRWYAAHGVTHVLIDTRYFPLTPAPGWPGWVYEVTQGRQFPLFSQHGVQVYSLPPAR